MSEYNRKTRVLVLGGNGFIGSQVVKFLANKAQVTIGTRNRKPQTNEITIRMHEMLEQSKWESTLSSFDVVVNSVGILRERKNESYADVHTNSVSALAKACMRLDIKLIHVSALGLSATAGSRFIRSKYAGEQAILNSGANAVIVRPSLLDGEGGFGAKWFRRVALWPIQFVMQSKGLVAPLQVSDLGEAIANIVFYTQRELPKVVELGGNDVMSIAEYLTQLRQTKQLKSAPQIPINKLIVRLFSHIFDVFQWTPLSFGHYELMQGFNAPKVNYLPKLLGRWPSEIGWQDKTEQEGILMIP